MEPASGDAIEEEIRSTTCQVLRTLGRVGALTGNERAMHVAEVLCDLVSGGPGRRNVRRWRPAPREEYATSDPLWLPPPSDEP